MKSDLAKKIYELSHVTGRFTGRSGMELTEYFDKYIFEGNPKVLNEVCEEMLGLVPQNIDALAALELGGVPVATMLSQKTNIPTLFVRKKPKEYGMRKFVEGGDVKNRNLLIVEDVVTTGGQIILSVNDLRQVGAEVKDAICVVDREQGARENLKAEGIELHPLFTMTYMKSVSNS